MSESQTLTDVSKCMLQVLLRIDKNDQEPKEPIKGDLTCWGSRGVVCLTRLLDAVVVVVVISIMDVDVSERLAVVLDCGVMEEGESPTSRTLPWILMLGSPSAAMLNTFRPL